MEAVDDGLGGGPRLVPVVGGDCARRAHRRGIDPDRVRGCRVRTVGELECASRGGQCRLGVAFAEQDCPLGERAGERLGDHFVGGGDRIGRVGLEQRDRVLGELRRGVHVAGEALRHAGRDQGHGTTHPAGVVVDGPEQLDGPTHGLHGIVEPSGQRLRAGKAHQDPALLVAAVQLVEQLRRLLQPLGGVFEAAGLQHRVGRGFQRKGQVELQCTAGVFVQPPQRGDAGLARVGRVPPELVPEVVMVLRPVAAVHPSRPLGFEGGQQGRGDGGFECRANALAHGRSEVVVELAMGQAVHRLAVDLGGGDVPAHRDQGLVEVVAFVHGAGERQRGCRNCPHVGREAVAVRARQRPQQLARGRRVHAATDLQRGHAQVLFQRRLAAGGEAVAPLGVAGVDGPLEQLRRDEPSVKEQAAGLLVAGDGQEPLGDLARVHLRGHVVEAALDVLAHVAASRRVLAEIDQLERAAELRQRIGRVGRHRDRAGRQHHQRLAGQRRDEAEGELADVGHRPHLVETVDHDDQRSAGEAGVARPIQHLVLRRVVAQLDLRGDAVPRCVGLEAARVQMSSHRSFARVGVGVGQRGRIGLRDPGALVAVGEADDTADECRLAASGRAGDDHEPGLACAHVHDQPGERAVASGEEVADGTRAAACGEQQVLDNGAASPLLEQRVEDQRAGLADSYCLRLLARLGPLAGQRGDQVVAVEVLVVERPHLPSPLIARPVGEQPAQLARERSAERRLVAETRGQHREP